MTMQDFRGQGSPADIGTYQLACGALVYKYTFSGVTYICAAKRGDTGWVLIGYGIVASTVLQAANDYLASKGGGTIFISPGDYTLTATLSLSPKVSLRGASIYSVSLINDNNIDLITIAAAKPSLCTVDDLTLDCAKSSQVAGSGIKISSPTTDVWINRVFIKQFKQHGITIEYGFNHFITNCLIEVGDGNCVNVISDNVLNTRSVWISHNYLLGGKDAVHIERISTPIYNVIITDNIILNSNEHGIHLMGATECMICSNRIDSPSQSAVDTFDCINLERDVTFAANPAQTLVLGNRLSTSDGNARYAIYHRGVNILITSNIVYAVGSFVAPIIFSPAIYAGTIVSNNVGYVNENTVLSPAFAIDAIAVVTVTIAHGLSLTPNVADCQLTIIEDTAVNDWVAGFVKVVSTGAVNVIANVNVTAPSLTAGATAKLTLRVVSLH